MVMLITVTGDSGNSHARNAGRGTETLLSAVPMQGVYISIYQPGKEGQIAFILHS